MFLNLLLLHYNLTIKNYKIFNKIIIISFILYWIAYIFLGNFTILLAVFDSIYFTQKYNLLKTQTQYKNNHLYLNSRLGNKELMSVINKFKSIDKNANSIKKIIIDPEFERSKYKPHIIDLKETLVQVSNNLL